jgi:hypothetical protein
MIILMIESEINRNASRALCSEAEESQVYPDVTLFNVKDTTLTIVDLEADSQFQLLSTPASFADFLLKNGLSDEIKTINLIVSDVTPETSLFGYAQKLCDALREKDKVVVAHVVSDANYRLCFAVPPSNQDLQWYVYGITFSDYLKDFVAHESDESKPLTLNYPTLRAYPKKQMVWKGENLLAWLEGRDRTIVSEKSKK